jgi:hypothetical protein
MGESSEVRLAAHDAILAQMNERLNDIRAWLMALTGLMGAQFAAIVALAILVARR